MDGQYVRYNNKIKEAKNTLNEFKSVCVIKERSEGGYYLACQVNAGILLRIFPVDYLD